MKYVHYNQTKCDRLDRLTSRQNQTASYTLKQHLNQIHVFRNIFILNGIFSGLLCTPQHLYLSLTLEGDMTRHNHVLVFTYITFFSLFKVSKKRKKGGKNFLLDQTVLVFVRTDTRALQRFNFIFIFILYYL